MGAAFAAPNCQHEYERSDHDRQGRVRPKYS
jgi:hypothetical protein